MRALISSAKIVGTYFMSVHGRFTKCATMVYLVIGGRLYLVTRRMLSCLLVERCSIEENIPATGAEGGPQQTIYHEPITISHFRSTLATSGMHVITHFLSPAHHTPLPPFSTTPNDRRGRRGGVPPRPSSLASMPLAPPDLPSLLPHTARG